MTGVGFGLGDVVLQDVLTELALLPADLGRQRVVFVIDAEPVFFDRALHITADLRGRGVTAVYSYKRQSLVKQLKQASSRGAVRAVFVDQDTADKGVVGVKDLETGVQASMPVAALLDDPYGTVEPSS